MGGSLIYIKDGGQRAATMHRLTRVRVSASARLVDGERISASLFSRLILLPPPSAAERLKQRSRNIV